MHDPVISDRMTEPPAHFTEATLLYAMEHIAKYVSEESFRKILNETAGLGTRRPGPRSSTERLGRTSL